MKPKNREQERIHKRTLNGHTQPPHPRSSRLPPPATPQPRDSGSEIPPTLNRPVSNHLDYPPESAPLATPVPLPFSAWPHDDRRPPLQTLPHSNQFLVERSRRPWVYVVEFEFCGGFGWGLEHKVKMVKKVGGAAAESQTSI